MKKVMIVDDNYTTRAALGHLLNRRGYWTKLCFDSRDAMSSIEAGTVPDVLIADYYLTDGDGLSLMQAVRGLPDGKDISMIMYTAATAEFVERLRPKIAEVKSLLIFKPCEIEELLETVDRIAFPNEQGRPPMHRQPGDIDILNKLSPTRNQPRSHKP